MIIKNKMNNKITFGEINNGDIFSSKIIGYDILIKIPSVYDDGEICNCYNLTNDNFYFFYDNEEIIRYPKTLANIIKIFI